MWFESILNLKEPIKGMTRPVFFIDLNIDQIIDRVAKNDTKIKEHYEYFPLDEECENYRRKIYRDIKEKDLYKALSDYCIKYNEFRDFENRKKTTRVDVQEPVWHFSAVKTYSEALIELLSTLKEKVPESDGFKMLMEYLETYTSKEVFKSAFQSASELSAELSNIDVEASLENGRVVVSISDKKENEETEQEDDSEDPEKDTIDYEEFLRYFDSENDKTFVSPFALVNDLTSFEQEIVKIVIKRNPELFKKAEKLYEEYENFEDNVFSRHADELPFYLTFYEFQMKMQQAGFKFTEPTCDEDKKISAEGLYDLALACVNLEKNKPVVSNDFYYDDTDLFFVLTGPNQGGKTTFARSLGQLVFFTKMGLDVAADKANIHWFSDILTHFSVEESVETGRGKLMEELVRLSPMMKNSRNNAFVVINELFTTAANFDAIIMGKNVLSHFIGEKCHGIYVTHLRELCDVDERVAGLSAQLDENRIQNFKILRHGVDYEGCAENQINKYRLNYNQLKERLKERLG